MNVRSHHLSERGVDTLMAFDLRQLGERCGDDAYAEVPSPVASPGMAGVLVAFVDDVELRRSELGDQ